MKVLITGVNGQDGAYMAANLLSRGYSVTGLARQSRPLVQDLDNYIQGSITDHERMSSIIRDGQFDAIYNFAGLTVPDFSWQNPAAYEQTNVYAVLNIAECILKRSPHTRLFSASSSHIFGDITMTCTEKTNLHPLNPYAAGKASLGVHLNLLRAKHNLHAVTGVFFNHDSPMRDPRFWAGYLADNAISIYRGQQQKMHVKTLSTYRDFGHAKDFVEAARLVTEAEKPSDYIIATGKTHSTLDWVVVAFDYLGLNWQDHVVESHPYMPPAFNGAHASIDKIKGDVGWTPKICFFELVREIIEERLHHA